MIPVDWPQRWERLWFTSWVLAMAITVALHYLTVGDWEAVAFVAGAWFLVRASYWRGYLAARDSTKDTVWVNPDHERRSTTHYDQDGIPCRCDQ